MLATLQGPLATRELHNAFFRAEPFLQQHLESAMQTRTGTKALKTGRLHLFPATHSPPKIPTCQLDPGGEKHAAPHAM